MGREEGIGYTKRRESVLIQNEILDAHIRRCILHDVDRT